MTKKNNSFLFAVVFVAIILLAVFVTAALTNGFTNADLYGWLEDLKSGDVNESGDISSGITDGNGENLESGVLYSMPSQLNFSAAALARQDTGMDFVEVLLQATVLPVDATNKKVDWSAIWADGSDSSDLSNYLTVTPQSDGSVIASVKCYKAFDKDINVIVTTRDGGYTAVCVVSYVGDDPSILKIVFDDIKMQDGVYVLSPSSTVTAQLKLSDLTGDLSYSTSMNFVVSTEYVPSLVKDDVYLLNYKWNKWAGYSLNVDEDFLSFKGSSEQLIHDSVEFTVVEDVLTLKVSNPYFAYSSESSGDDLFIYDRVLTKELANTLYEDYDKFESECPYDTLIQLAAANEETLNNRTIKVTVSETNSGLSTTFLYRITNDVRVSSVSLDKDIIEY